MNNQEAYNAWAANYDTVINETRDLEGIALRETLSQIDLSHAHMLEIGCGTGKNTEWLQTRVKHLTGADFSEEMLNQARRKITAGNVSFHKTDIREKWPFAAQQFDLITCSLILEHIQDINFVFRQANAALKSNGLFYIGELHPFKQYQGSKARFDTAKGMFELECFIHHISDFFEAAKTNGFECLDVKEWFDDNDITTIPRILTLMFKKK